MAIQVLTIIFKITSLDFLSKVNIAIISTDNHILITVMGLCLIPKALPKNPYLFPSGLHQILRVQCLIHLQLQVIHPINNHKAYHHPVLHLLHSLVL